MHDAAMPTDTVPSCGADTVLLHASTITCIRVGMAAAKTVSPIDMCYAPDPRGRKHVL